MHYHLKWCNTVQYHIIFWNTIWYNATLCNTTQSWGAYYNLIFVLPIHWSPISPCFWRFWLRFDLPPRHRERVDVLWEEAGLRHRHRRLWVWPRNLHYGSRHRRVSLFFWSCGHCCHIMSNQRRMPSCNEEFSKVNSSREAFSFIVSVLHNSCDVIFGFRAQCTVSQSVVVGFASSRFCGHLLDLTSNVCREEKRKEKLGRM